MEIGELKFCDLSLKDYKSTLALQVQLHTQVAQGLTSPIVLLVEHPAVLTLGKHANLNFITSSWQELKELAIEVERTDRGGEVTAHMPGQLVAYPIIPLKQIGLGVKDYVRVLENSVIDCLKHYYIEANVDPINPGVWIRENKICAIGIRVSKGVSYHGLALNVDNDVSLFGHIIPCGIEGRGVTNIIRESRSKVNKSDLKSHLASLIASGLGFRSACFVELTTICDCDL
ncbi:MAG: lipoyl(octanoyl) transferase LipB [Bdellovibrionota bacterium]